MQNEPYAFSGGLCLYARTQKRIMPNTIKDLVRLHPDRVSLWNGKEWQQVMYWRRIAAPEDRKQVAEENRSSRFRGKATKPPATYEVRLRNGLAIGCLHGTPFMTVRGKIYVQDLRPGDVLVRCVLPEPTELVRPTMLPDKLIGWFVGLYIAEGSHSADTIQIASNINESDRFLRLQQIADAFHGSVAVHRTGGKSATANLNGPVLNGIIDAYVAGTSARTKHLNVRCWERSNDFLIALLQGYLSADAHYDEENDRWRLGFTLNHALANDLRSICARIGASIRLNLVTHVMKGRKFPGFRGEIRFTKSNHHNSKPDTEIVTIGQSRARSYWSFAIAGSIQRFALAAGPICVSEVG